MKKLLTIICFISFVLLFSIIPSRIVYGASITRGDYTYEKLGNDSVKLTDYKGTDKNLVIPSKLDGYKVISIGDRAFDYCTKLMSITIPDSVQQIGDNPFHYCLNLTRIIVSPDHPYLATLNGVLFSKADKRLVCYPCAFDTSFYTIPKGIEIIGGFAFESCSYLRSITIPDSVTDIKEGAFSGSGIRSIDIPNSVKSIGKEAFSECFHLSSISIPNSVISIGDEAFHACNALTSITIPNSVYAVGTNPFSSCRSLTSINVASGHQYLEIIDGALICKTDNRLVCYPIALSKLHFAIPSGVEIIGDKAFYACDNLFRITIPNGVTHIGRNAFTLCNNILSFKLPDSISQIDQSAFSWCTSLADINMPNKVSYIGPDVFYNCDNLYSITVSRNSYAKEYCVKNNLPYTYPDNDDWLTGN